MSSDVVAPDTFLLDLQMAIPFLLTLYGDPLRA